MRVYETQYNSNINPSFAVKNNYIDRIELSGHKAFVAEIDGDIIGFIYGSVYQIPELDICPVAIVDALFVEEEYRGVATELFHAFKRFARDQKTGRIELKVMSENANALHFYQSLGFYKTKKYMTLNLNALDNQN